MPLSYCSRRFATLLVLTGIILASVVGIARPAAAHDALAGSTPATGGTVTTTLTTVTVTFSEPPLADFASALALKVADPTGATVTTGAPTAEGASLTAPVAITRAGVHTVTWQSVSSDGHPVSGTFTFTYAGPLPTAEPKPTTTPTPTRTTELLETASTTAQPPSAAFGGGTAFAPAALIIGTLLVLVMGAVIWLTRRRRGGPTTPTRPDADE
ncbi:copper resistance CopC family protein [Frondihabitans sp. VKM Ac-2883]|uniref:copper resistance CopC family protein n=1 Tax=Frondihabitans sp. VKM Ac-2883 TaxID=2783823 RepID=UPI00188C6EF0|nr:copper resistance CopC family protein [Frondihabitans sp. VKM Ac-2883]MBF4575468.1 copper resistance protein CopC [Frondihabitans sp. VKM Ac-2883]